MEWVTENWQSIVALLGAVVLVARLIVKLTPTPADDAWLAKVIDALKHVGLHIDSGNGGGPPTAALLILGLSVAFIGGCQAPQAVRDAYAFEGGVWQSYIRNTDRIHDLTLAAYKTARDKDLEHTTAKALEKVRAAAVDGRLPVADFEAALKTIVEERDKANGQTAAIQAKIRSLITVNNGEVRKALRIRGSMQEWLEAGLDESVIPELTQEVFGLLGDVRGGVKVPAPAPGGTE